MLLMIIIIYFFHTGPTYLIFQYCCYGDLLNYLKTNRECYHKSVTDAFIKERFSSLYHNLQTRTNSRWEQGETRVWKDSKVHKRRHICEIYLLEVRFNITITCFLSELVRSEDNYVPMHRSTTGGQEDIALLTLNFEGEKNTIHGHNILG